MNKPIFLDMDGVMNNFGENFIAWVNTHYPKAKWEETYGYELYKWFKVNGICNKTYMLEAFSDIHFWDSLVPNEDIRSNLFLLENVSVCTLPFGWSFCPQIKEYWLTKYFPSIDTTRNLIMMKEKYLLAGSGILVDDYSENVRKFIENGGEAYLYETFYNYKEDLPKIKSLRELKRCA